MSRRKIVKVNRGATRPVAEAGVASLPAESKQVTAIAPAGPASDAEETLDLPHPFAAFTGLVNATQSSNPFANFSGLTSASPAVDSSNPFANFKGLNSAVSGTNPFANFSGLVPTPKSATLPDNSSSAVPSTVIETTGTAVAAQASTEPVAAHSATELDVVAAKSSADAPNATPGHDGAELEKDASKATPGHDEAEAGENEPAE